MDDNVVNLSDVILLQDWDDRREEDKLQLERLFVLIRNVLMIPPNYDREKVSVCIIHSI